MKNLFDANATTEIIARIDELKPDSQRQWGKMNVAQMMAHCTAALETATDQRHPPRIFIGKILGPIFKSSFLNEKPFAKNSPTDKSFIMTGEKDFDKEKIRLKNIILSFANGGEAKCTSHPHSFFGKLTPNEWARGMYKHMDHHLRQFGV